MATTPACRVLAAAVMLAALAPGAVTPSLFDIVPPAVFEVLRRRLVHRPNDLGRQPDDQRTRRDLHPFQQNRTGADDRAAADAGAVEDDRTHPDQAIVLDRAAVQNDAVAHRNPISNQAGHSGIGMDHRQVLNVARFADHDPVGVAADDRVVPDTRVLADLDIADQDRSSGNEHGRVDHVVKSIEAASLDYKPPSHDRRTRAIGARPCSICRRGSCDS